MRRLRSRFILALAACALTVATAAAPAGAKLRKPSLTAPVAGAQVQAIPAFSWKAVKSAAKYEFQLAADSRFSAPVATGVFQTKNLHATIDKALPDGTYYWRVRAISASGSAGSWTVTRSLVKAWTQQPALVSPGIGSTVTYPSEPLVLHWSPVAHAYKYLVTVTTDPTLSSPVMVGLPVETSATSFALPTSLSDGNTYYWAVTPEDGEKHRGQRSVVGSFTWSWPATVAGTRVQDPQTLNDATTVFSPLLTWQPVAGAATYQVEISTSATFASGSKVCCDDTVIGTSLSPSHILPNVSFHAVGFYWRVRAVDIDGHVGPWTQGPNFQEVFDPATPSIPNLQLTQDVDPTQAPQVLNAGDLAEAPVIRWNPVPHASSYEVDMGPLEAQGCDYSPANPIHGWVVRTATTAFTPLAYLRALQTPAGAQYTGTVGVDGRDLEAGTWCVRVRARADRDANLGDVVSDWTQLGSDSTGAFQYDPTTQCDDGQDNDGDGLKDSADPGCHVNGDLTQPYDPYLFDESVPTGTATDLHAEAADYHTVGTVNGMPVFTWAPISGAGAYWIIVARDQNLTDVVDESLTNVPAYAPRHGSTLINTYSDQDQSYYWAIVPALNVNGSGTAGSPTDDHPQQFKKSSTGPAPLAPSDGAALDGQPTFRWGQVDGARNYCLQVALDEGFQNLVSQGGSTSGACPNGVVTDATAYTSASSFPSNTVLYWRVHGLDENGLGMNSSPTDTFQMQLGVPAPAPTNAGAGDDIPVLQWSSVPGATSYDVHVDQVDGTTKDFHTRSTAFTGTGFFGSGVWRWQVRANFAKAPSGERNGAYTDLLPFTRRIAPPPNAVGTRQRGSLLITWDPSPVTIKQYRVQVSNTDSFTSVIDTATVDGTAWAPKLITGYQGGGKLYWRVASVDEGLNVGGFASGTFTLSKGLHVTISGAARKHLASTLVVKVIDANGRAVNGARITARGAGIKLRARKTKKHGTVRVRVKPRRGGTIVFTVKRSGYSTAIAKLKAI